MCMADIRISRFITTTYTEIPIGTGDNIIAQASKQRVGIEIFYSPSVDPVVTPNDQCFIAIGQQPIQGLSIPIQLCDYHLKWTFKDDGDTPQKSFHAQDYNNGGGTVIVIEHWLPESILAAYLKKLGE